MSSNSEEVKALIIRHCQEQGLETLPDLPLWKFRFPIKSESSSRVYNIAQYHDGSHWGCSCPGWKISKHGVRTCKHLTHLAPLLAKVEEVQNKNIS